MCMGCGMGIPVCASGLCSASSIQMIFHLLIPLGGAGLGIFIGFIAKEKNG